MRFWWAYIGLLRTMTSNTNVRSMRLCLLWVREVGEAKFSWPTREQVNAWLHAEPLKTKTSSSISQKPLKQLSCVALNMLEALLTLLHVFKKYFGKSSHLNS